MRWLRNIARVAIVGLVVIPEGRGEVIQGVTDTVEVVIPQVRGRAPKVEKGGYGIFISLVPMGQAVKCLSLKCSEVLADIIESSLLRKNQVGQ